VGGGIEGKRILRVELKTSQWFELLSDKGQGVYPAPCARQIKGKHITLHFAVPASSWRRMGGGDEAAD
jgi:hypothetical protein